MRREDRARFMIVDVMTWPSAGATRSCPAGSEARLDLVPEAVVAERATFLVVKLVRAFGGCLGSKRR